MFIPSKEQTVLYSLFGYETDGGKKSILWENPSYFMTASGQGGKELDADFAEWKNTKRGFTQEEIISGVWIKIGDNGYSFIMKCFENGSVNEHNIFDEHAEVNGTWQLVRGILVTNILQYNLNIVASKTGSIHSGIEFVEKQYKPHAYYKVVHLE